MAVGEAVEAEEEAVARREGATSRIELELGPLISVRRARDRRSS